MIIWDREAELPKDSGDALLWRSYASGPRARSVPAHLETHAERLRAKYLAFIHDLGENSIDGKTVIEHLALDGEFSFWWMTRLAEKSPYKSPGVYASLRLLALEEILLESKLQRLELDSADDALAEAVEALCRNLKIEFARRPGARRARPLGLHPLRGLLSFAKWLIIRWPLRSFEKTRWFSGDGAVFACSFFAQYDAAYLAGGEFRSHYWESLPERLHEAGRRVNWIHHFLHADGAGYGVHPSLARLAGFNADGEKQGLHSFLESYLSLRLVARAFGHWLRLLAAYRRTAPIAPRFRPKGSAVDLWPVLADDWGTSLAGRVGALNVLWLELFDAALADIPPQKTGLYLCENQAWEPALLRAWRRHGHGTITGVAHATVPFWHLYYFDDPRSRRPSPDRLAANGPAAIRILTEAGFTADKLVEVEALRYLDLPKVAADGPPGARVIVLGDVIPESMRSLLSNLEGALKLLPPDCRFTFKPHPIFDVDLSAYPGLKLERTTLPLERVLGGFDLALAGNSTSAAVDAYLAGLPVIIGLDGGELNLSPLRGEPGACFVGTSAELAEALNAALRAPSVKPGRDAFFFLDPELPRWRKLLQMDGTP